MRQASLPLNTFYVPCILRLQAEIGAMFADNMDLLSLTRWRLTCKTNYEQAVSSLRRSLLTMLSPFVPSPVVILDIITEHRSVFGGGFALAFLLRDRTILPNQLDIYVSDYEFDALCSAILKDPAINNAMTSHDFTDHGVLDALRTLVSRILTIKTSRGKIIKVHRSYTSSATAPISRASCTAFSNFVTAYGFGCSYPILTFDRRALVTDQELPYIPVINHEIHDRLMDHNFSLAFSLTAWPEFRRYVPPPPRRRRRERSGSGDRSSVADVGNANEDPAQDSTYPLLPLIDPSTVGDVPAQGSAFEVSSLVMVGVDQSGYGASESNWLAPPTGNTATGSGTDEIPVSEQLALGERVLDFGAPSYLGYNVSAHTEPLQRAHAPPGENGDRSVETTGFEISPLGYAGHIDDAATSIPGDTESILESIYSLGVNAFLAAGGPASPPPTSSLLSVHDPDARIRLDLPFYGDTLQPVNDASHTQTPAVLDNQGSILPEGPGADSDLTLLDFLDPTVVDPIDSNTLVHQGQYYNPRLDDSTGTQSTALLDSTRGPSLEWSIELRRYVSTGPGSSAAIGYDPLDLSDHVASGDALNNSLSTGSDPLDLYTPLRVEPDTLPDLSWPLDDLTSSTYDIGPLTGPSTSNAQSGASPEAATHNHPLNVAMPTPIPSDSIRFTFLDFPSVPNTRLITGEFRGFEAAHTDRALPAASGAHVPSLLRPGEGASLPVKRTDSTPSEPNSHSDSRVLPSGPDDSAAHRGARLQLPSGEPCATVGNPSSVPQGTVAVDEHGPHSSISTAPRADALESQSSGTAAASDFDIEDGDAASDYSDGADTVIDPPPAVECWRHRYVCPSQGRYFGDRGSFVDFFDPLRGGEKYCAQRNMAPFGPMVVWRILSTFNCEEGCDMYDDVLEEGVTSIPVLIRRDPFGELRDVVSDRAMAKFNKHRSLSR